MSNTPKQQLMGMMSPQQARLLDDQLREQQIQQQAGGGMFSGAVAATLRGNDMLGNVFRGRQAGVNEQANIDQRNKLQAEAEAADKLQRQRTAVKNNILIENDVKKLEAIRDGLIERNTPEAAASAKLAQDKIDKLKKEIKETGGASTAISQSGLPEDRQQILKDEVESGVTKPQDVPKRIKAMNEEVTTEAIRTSGNDLIDGYGLNPQEAEKFKKMLAGGVPLSTIVSKIEPKTDELTNQNLITMYRFFTPESVDAYKAAVEAGTKVTEMPRLVSLDKGKDGKLITGKPTTMQVASLKSAIEMMVEFSPEVEKLYKTDGWFFPEVDTKKVIGTTSQIYALANQKNISIDEAIIEYATQRNSMSAKQARLAELEAKAAGGA
jgi:hypothetical protein